MFEYQSKQLAVKLNGKIQYYISKRLVKRQRVSKQNLQKIIFLHELKLIIYELIKLTEDRAELKDYVTQLTNIEFRLQDSWGFPRNSEFHRFWETPKCTCPKLDNEERVGTQFTITNGSCILHGEEVDEGINVEYKLDDTSQETKKKL